MVPVYPVSDNWPLATPDPSTSGPRVPPTDERLNVTVTSSVEAVHGLLLIVHLNTYVVPPVPLNDEDELEALPKEPPAPLTTLQEPVPMEGVFAARVTDVDPQVDEPVWSAPAFAVVGLLLNLTVTSSVDEEQGLLLMVHRRTYVAPADPLNVEDGLETLPKEPPVPLMTLQEPVPIEGALAARVTVVAPQVEDPV